MAADALITDRLADLTIYVIRERTADAGSCPTSKNSTARN